VQYTEAAAGHGCVAGMASVTLEDLSRDLGAIRIETRHRTVNGLQMRAQPMLVIEHPGGELDLRGAEPQMQEARGVTAAETQRIEGHAGGRRVEQEQVPEAMWQ
jgi:hypothetical protein